MPQKHSSTSSTPHTHRIHRTLSTPIPRFTPSQPRQTNKQTPDVTPHVQIYAVGDTDPVKKVHGSIDALDRDTVGASLPSLRRKSMRRHTKSVSNLLGVPGVQGRNDNMDINPAHSYASIPESASKSISLVSVVEAESEAENVESTINGNTQSTINDNVKSTINENVESTINENVESTINENTRKSRNGARKHINKNPPVVTKPPPAKNINTNTSARREIGGTTNKPKQTAEAVKQVSAVVVVDARGNRLVKIPSLIDRPVSMYTSSQPPQPPNSNIEKHADNSTHQPLATLHDAGPIMADMPSFLQWGAKLESELDRKLFVGGSKARLEGGYGGTGRSVRTDTSMQSGFHKGWHAGTYRAQTTDTAYKNKSRATGMHSSTASVQPPTQAVIRVTSTDIPELTEPPRQTNSAAYTIRQRDVEQLAYEYMSTHGNGTTYTPSPTTRKQSMHYAALSTDTPRSRERRRRKDLDQTRMYARPLFVEPDAPISLGPVYTNIRDLVNEKIMLKGMLDDVTCEVRALKDEVNVYDAHERQVEKAVKDLVQESLALLYALKLSGHATQQEIEHVLYLESCYLKKSGASGSVSGGRGRV